MKSVASTLKDISKAEYKCVELKLEKYGLVKGQAELLSVIKENDGATQNLISEILNIKYSSISLRLKRLESLGYITRVVDNENLKYKKIYITTDGKKAATQCNRILNEFEKNIFKGFSKKDERFFYECIERINKNIKKLKPPIEFPSIGK